MEMGATIALRGQFSRYAGCSVVDKLSLVSRVFFSPMRLSGNVKLSNHLALAEPQ